MLWAHKLLFFNHLKTSAKSLQLYLRIQGVFPFRSNICIPSQACLFCISSFRICLIGINLVYASTKLPQTEILFGLWTSFLDLITGCILIPQSMALKLDSPHPHIKPGSQIPSWWDLARELQGQTDVSTWEAYLVSENSFTSCRSPTPHVVEVIPSFCSLQKCERIQ